jgi:hypothetical protein
VRSTRSDSACSASASRSYAPTSGADRRARTPTAGRGPAQSSADVAGRGGREAAGGRRACRQELEQAERERADLRRRAVEAEEQAIRARNVVAG